MPAIMSENAIPHCYGTAAECAFVEAFLSPQLVAQAEQMRINQWDWHPEAVLPDGYMLVAYSDGVWITDANCVLSQAIKFVRVGDSWT